MSYFIDRRSNARNKSAVNRQRFIRRYRSHIKRAVEDAVNRRSITDMERGEEVSIPTRDISEPVFQHGQGGKLGKKLIPNKPHSMKTLEAMARAGKIKKVMYEKYSTAFNQDQTDLKEEVEQVPAVTESVEGGNTPEFKACLETVQGWVGDEGIVTSEGGNRACYSPSLDSIKMPALVQFHSPAEYYHTFFHEMAHSTGHTSRLDRLEPATFGSDPYAKEELVAELTASFLSNAHGIFARTEENSQAYFKNWADVLKADKKLIFKASREAQKAFDLITNA